jgi:phenylacetate-CoA ligase
LIALATVNASSAEGARVKDAAQPPAYYGGPQGMLIPPVLELYRLRKQQWQSPEVLQESQRKRLHEALTFAYNNVRYYRRLFDSSSVNPEGVKTIEDLEGIPVTERRVLQQAPLLDITSKNADLEECHRILTAGSSGKPLMVYRSLREDNLIDIAWAFSFLENGQRFRDVCADFHSFQGIPRRWFEDLGIWRRVTIPSLAEPTERIDVLKRARPDVIRGNPWELVDLAIAIQRHAIQGVNPRLVFTMGSLLDKASRELIQTVFGAEVFDYYGATELGCIGWECSFHKGYHINTNEVVVEVIDRNGQPTGIGHSGRIVCTGLTSRTMPFIRYNIGDVGTLDDRVCSCGRGLPLLKNLEGRSDDFFISTDGNRYSPGYIVNQIKLIPGIQQFKVIQEDETTVTVQIVTNGSSTATIELAIKALFNRIMGNDAILNVVFLDAISQDASGKIQSIVSKVRRNT